MLRIILNGQLSTEYNIAVPKAINTTILTLHYTTVLRIILNGQLSTEYNIALFYSYYSQNIIPGNSYNSPIDTVTCT